MNKNEKFVIAINREVGSGGHVVGEKLAERLGVKFYDKDIIKELTKRFNLSVDELEEVRSSKFNWWNNLIESYMNRYKVEERFAIESTVATTENVFRVESDFLKQLADDESCVIAGRSGFFIFRDHPNALKIFIRSKMEKRIERMMRVRNMTEEQAVATIEKVDKGREAYTKKFAGKSRYDARNYDLVIDITGMTEDRAVDLIMDYIDKTFRKEEKK